MEAGSCRPANQKVGRGLLCTQTLVAFIPACPRGFVGVSCACSKVLGFLEPSGTPQLLAGEVASRFHPKGATHNSNPTRGCKANQNKRRDGFQTQEQWILDVGLPDRMQEAQLNLIFGQLTNDFSM